MKIASEHRHYSAGHRTRSGVELAVVDGKLSNEPGRCRLWQNQRYYILRHPAGSGKETEGVPALTYDVLRGTGNVGTCS